MADTVLRVRLSTRISASEFLNGFVGGVRLQSWSLERCEGVVVGGQSGLLVLGKERLGLRVCGARLRCPFMVVVRRTRKRERDHVDIAVLFVPSVEEPLLRLQVSFSFSQRVGARSLRVCLFVCFPMRLSPKCFLQSGKEGICKYTSLICSKGSHRYPTALSIPPLAYCTRFRLYVGRLIFHSAQPKTGLRQNPEAVS